MYGIQLSQQGLLHDHDVTVSVVRPEGPAAMARVQVGDVITYIGDVKILDRDDPTILNIQRTGSIAETNGHVAGFPSRIRAANEGLARGILGTAHA